MTDSDNDTSLFGTEAHSEETLRMRQELINAGRAIRANDEVAFDTDLDTASAEVLATQLASQKDMGEAQLSYALHVLKENKAWIDHGFETFQDYVDLYPMHGEEKKAAAYVKEVVGASTAAGQPEPRPEARKESFEARQKEKELLLQARQQRLSQGPRDFNTISQADF